MKKVISLLWVASIVAAFYVGKSVQVSDSSPTTVTTASTTTKSLVTDKPEIVAESDKQDNTLAVVDPPVSKREQMKPIDPVQVAADTYELFDTGVQGDMSAIVKAYHWIEGLSLDEILMALNSLSPDINDAAYMQSVALLLDRYATLSPQSAMDYVNNNIDQDMIKMGMTAQVLNKWSAEDPIAAFDWYNQQEKSSRSRFDPGLYMIFRGLANESVDLALDYINQLSDPNGIDRAIGAIASVMDDKVEFISLIEKVRSYDDMSIERSVFTNWVRQDEEGILEWYDELENIEYKQAAKDEIFTALQFQDQETAADWLLSASTTETIDEDVEKALRSWAYDSPESALSWIQKQSNIDSAKATKKLLNSSAYRNPEFAINNMALLSSEKDKVDVSYSIYAGYKNKSKARAEQFLKDSPFKRKLQEKIARIEKVKPKN